MAVGGVVVIVGIVLALADRTFLGLLVVVVGLLLGGFRRGRWY